MCENCMYSEYDEMIEQYICSYEFVIDEDDFARMNYINRNNNICPYFRMGNEYTIVKKQN